jgi:hypothetical protein
MARIALIAAGAAAGILAAVFVPGLGAALAPTLLGEIIAGGAAGAAVGSGIGALAFPAHIPLPPLQNLQVSNATPGAPIPFGYGTVRIGGQFIWCPGIIYTTSQTPPANTVAQ